MLSNVVMIDRQRAVCTSLNHGRSPAAGCALLHDQSGHDSQILDAGGTNLLHSRRRSNNKACHLQPLP